MSDHHKFKIQRVSDPFDPNRCNATIPSTGQCHLLSVPGSHYCPCHGGNKALEAKNKANIYDMKLAEFRSRLTDLTNSDTIKSLRDEVALVRFLIQKHISSFETKSELITHSAAITQMILTVESLAQSCLTVEHSLDSVMDTEDAFGLAFKIIEYTMEKIDPTPEFVADITELLERFEHKALPQTIGNYVISRWADELKKFATQERIITLRDEIGVLRLITEEQLNACTQDYDLVVQSLPICSNIQKIQKLVESCHKLEKKIGLLLDEETAQLFAQSLIEVAGNHLDSEVLDYVSRRITTEDSSPTPAADL